LNENKEEKENFRDVCKSLIVATAVVIFVISLSLYSNPSGSFLFRVAFLSLIIIFFLILFAVLIIFIVKARKNKKNKT